MGAQRIISAKDGAVGSLGIYGGCPPVTVDLITLHQEPGSIPANPNFPHPEPTPYL